jgi:serine O-acetyltransferase
MRLSAECLARKHDRFSTLRSNVSEDIARFLTKSSHDLARGDTWKTRWSAFLTPEVFPVFWYRVAHYLNVTGWPRLAIFVTRINSLLHKVYITPQSCIGPGFRLPHPAGVTFHGKAGRGLTIYSLGICCAGTDEWGGPRETGPALGEYVTIGAHAVVQGNVAVGDSTIVAYAARLDRDAPGGILVSSGSLRASIRSMNPDH